MNFHTEELLKNAELIELAKGHNLVVWSWGEDNNSKQTISWLKSKGVDGVTYDR